MSEGKIAALLKEKRKGRGMSVKGSVSELSKRGIDISEKTLYGWESGARQPDADTFLILCDIYEIKTLSEVSVKADSAALTPPELDHIKKYRTLDGHGKETVDVVLDKEVQRMEEMRKAEEKKVLKPKAAQEPEDKVVIPLMRNRASAGEGVSLEDDDFIPIVVDRAYETSKADFAVRVTGSSMEPKYYDGDVLLIRKQPSVDIGQIGIFTINDEGYVKMQGKDRLISVNPDYDDIYPSEYDDVRCKGLVLGKL